jgi:hypothetical protein
VDYFNKKIFTLESQQQQHILLNEQNITPEVNKSQPVNKSPQKLDNVEIKQQIPITTASKKPAPEMNDIINLPTTKAEININQHAFDESNFSYIPRLVDKSIRLPINKNANTYSKVKEKIKEHMEMARLELDFHKLEQSKDHVEAAIFYLRNIEEN